MEAQRQAEAIRIRGQLPRVFTPAAPVEHGELFIGRTSLISNVLQSVSSPGEHVLIFGERGVGKTSLASLIHYFWQVAYQDSELIAPWVTCHTADTYGTIWAKVLDAVTEKYESQNVPIPDESDPLAGVMEEMTSGAATPDIVNRFFAQSGRQFVITIDEFDRVEDQETRVLIADTIKTLSDHSVPTTLVIVGVADTVTDLIANHASIGRNLKQVLMPRMSIRELEDIVVKRLERVGMSIKKQPLNYIASFSQGLPHYTHLLALNTAIVAIDEGRTTATLVDLTDGINHSLRNAMHSVTAAYHAATASNKPKAIFKEVLLACALTKNDELGYFAPKDVIEPLRYVTNKPYEIPAFTRHLHAFCAEDRASVLESGGAPGRQRYRFTDPLLKPYVVLMGIREKAVDALYVLKQQTG